MIEVLASRNPSSQRIAEGVYREVAADWIPLRWIAGRYRTWVHLVMTSVCLVLAMLAFWIGKVAGAPWLVSLLWFLMPLCWVISRRTTVDLDTLTHRSEWCFLGRVVIARTPRQLDARTAELLVSSTRGGGREALVVFAGGRPRRVASFPYGTATRARRMLARDLDRARQRKAEQ